jgi:hypothetical protein
MMAVFQPNYEIQQLIGAIVISAQEAEQYLKMILPFTNSQGQSISGVLERNGELKKGTLGKLVGQFLDSHTSHTSDFVSRLKQIVTERNQIVHHFGETYGERLRSGQVELVADSLRAQLAGINAFNEALQNTALHLFEAVRDTTFNGTPEYQLMADLCASIRSRVSS